MSGLPVKIQQFQEIEMKKIPEHFHDNFEQQ